MLSRRAQVFAVAMVATMWVFLVADPSRADHINHGALGTTYVDGANAITDDWGDNWNEMGLICNGCANSWNTDIVVMWQAILWAEELLGSNDIDGRFGPRTSNATKAWQSRFGLTADGLVGDQTWGAADGRLSWSGCCGNILAYHARKHFNSTVTFRRGNRDQGNHDDGAYQILQTNGVSGRGQVRFSSSTHRIFFSSRTLTVNVCPC